MTNDKLKQLDMNTNDMKASMGSFFVPTPFILSYGGDQIVDKSLTKVSPGNKYVYGCGLRASGVDGVDHIPAWDIRGLPLRIQNLCVTVADDWGLTNTLHFNFCGIARNMDKNATVCVIGKGDSASRFIAACLPNFETVFALTNLEATIFAGQYNTDHTTLEQVLELHNKRRKR